MMKKKPHNYDFRLLPLAILCLVFILGLSSKPAFAVDYLVQSGEATLSTAETTKTVTLGTAVDKDHSFFLINSSCVSTTPNQFLVNAELATDGSALLLERNQTGSQVAYVSYSVIQHPDISVQHGTSKLSNTPQYSENITLSTPADPSKSIVILSRRSSAGNNSNHSDTQIAGYLTSSTNLFVQRDTGSTNTPYTWQVVTFNDGSTVQTGEDTFPDDLILAPKTLTTPVDPTRSWLYFTVRCGGSGMSYSMVRGRIADGDTIQFERYNSGAGYNPTVRWFVVEFPSGQGAEVQRGILTTTTTTQLELNDTLASSIDKTQTFLYHTSSGNGNGTAYPRPYWINRYTFCTGDDCTGVQFERWYDGQHGGIAWAAVTMPSCAGPGTPSGPDPSDGATGVSVDADLDWDDAPNATAYDVYFDTVDPPVAQVASDIASSDYTLPTLATSTQYFWKVVAKNACGDVEGPVWDFTTCPPAPAAPSNPSPPDDSTGISVDADLDWDDAADATAYDVYFDTVDPPVTKVGADIATSSLTLDRLICDTHYYWKVVAKNVCSDVEGPVWDFVTENVADPGMPSNPTPSNGATDVLLDTDLNWDDSTNAESYDVYFGTTYPPPLTDNTATSDYALPTLDADTTYYWKIVAKNRCATTDGPEWSFTTECPVPGTPSGPDPGDGQTDVSIDTDLDWSDAANADTYDVYVDTVDPPVTKVGSDIAVSTYTPSSLLYDTQYFWQIVAKNNCGNSATGPVWDFTTGSEPIGDHFASKSGSNSPPYESWATAAHNIQDAIGAASAGETVLVDDDTFTENVTINKNNLTLQSRYGRSSTFIVGQVQFDASADDLSGCVLDGFDIETSSDTGVVYVHTKVPYDYDPASDFSVTNTTIQNCNIHGNTGTGIMLRGHVSPTISNNNIYDNTSEGIEPYYSTTFELGGTGSPIIIKGNNIYSNGYGGMEIKGYNPAAWNDPPDIIVQVGGSQAGDGNHIHDNDGFFATGVKIDFVDTATIENNIIHHNGMLSYTTMWIGAGIRIDAAVQTTIKGNQIYENDAAGIRLVPNSGFPMPDPDGGGPLPTGNNTITIGGPLDADGNDIHNNPRGGIVFYVGATGGYESVEGSSIQKNYIHHNDYSGISIGVDLDGSTGQRAFNGKITITQNDLAYNGRGGIAIHTGCELEITKNNVHHSTARGGIHTGDDWGLFSRNMGDAVLTIRQNKVHHNFLGGIDIRHATADVINNLIYRNSRVGLRVGPSANQVTSNTFVNNGAIDRGGGMVFDDPYTCDPACEDGEGNCATDCQPYGIPSVPFPVENNISAYNERAGIMACFYSTDIYRDYNLLYSNNQSYLSGWCGDCASPDCSTGDRRDVKKCVGAQLGRGCTDDSVFCCSAPMGGGPLAGETLLFADPVFEDMDNDDYHLDPVAPSPAIGAGMGGADMGAYGGDFPIVDADIPDFS